MLTFLRRRQRTCGEGQRGFTLVELLTVIAIITILTTVVTVNLSSARRDARDTRRKADIQAIQSALELYYNAHGEFPPLPWGTNSNDQRWTALAQALKPYLASVPVDPTNNELEPWTSGALSYGYASASYGGCAAGQWYVLVYGLENTEDPTITGATGVPLCDGSTYNLRDVGQIAVGVSQ